MRASDAVPQDQPQELDEPLALWTQLRLAVQEFTDALQQASAGRAAPSHPEREAAETTPRKVSV